MRAKRAVQALLEGTRYAQRRYAERHRLWRAGQYSAQFAILLGITAAVAIGMQLLVRKSIQYSAQSLTTQLLGQFYASPSLLARGQSTTLYWHVPNGSNCAGSGGGTTGWTGSKSNYNSQFIPAVPEATTFRLACDVVGGKINLAARVTIGDIDHVGSTRHVTEQGDTNFTRVTTEQGSSTGKTTNEVNVRRALHD